MKKSWIIAGVIAFLAIIIYFSTAGVYNKLVKYEEAVSSAWSQVQNVYQRRADLIPNLVNTVKGYADFERQTLTDVVNARAKATSINLKADQLNPESMKQFQQAQDQLGSALSRLLVTIERYPDLKANQNFLDLQSQLEGSENRIARERRRFNETVQDYNTYRRAFPAVFFSGMMGFKEKAYFEAAQGAEKAPEVKF